MSNGYSREQTHISIPTAAVTDCERFGPWTSTWNPNSAEQPDLRAKSGHKLQPIDHFSTPTSKRSKKHVQSAIVNNSPKVNDVKRVSISAIDGNSAKLLNINQITNNTVLVSDFITEKEKCQLLVRTDAQLSPVSKIVLDTNKIPNNSNNKTKKDFIYKKNDLYYPESSKSPIFDVQITSRRVPRDLTLDLQTLYDKTYRPTLKLPRCKNNDNKIATINPHFIHGPMSKRGTSKGLLSNKKLPKLNSNIVTNGESIEEYLISPAIKRTSKSNEKRRAAVYTVKEGGNATISYLPYNAWTKKK